MRLCLRLHRRRRGLAAADCPGVIVTALLLMLFPGLIPASESTPVLPNIVFILADDLGYADTGATGARTIRTPNIDSIAAEGITLTNGYAASAICSPTRTALLTGMYPQRFRIGLDEPLRSSDAIKYDLGIPSGQATIASELAALGYQTALVGKWHQGIPPKHGPLEHGYEHFFGVAQGAADYFRHTMIRDGDSSSAGLFDGEEEIVRAGYLTDILGDEAVRLIKDISDRPLFLSLHFTAPHWPWEGRDDRSASEQLGDTRHHDGGSLETYAEMVEVLDENIGKVLTALDEAGRADDTIIIFTSDNGGERFSDTWPHIGLKGELFEGGIRVPLFVRWKDRITAGGETAQVATSMDFLPTLVSAAGGDVHDGRYDGMNLLPQLLDAEPVVERTLFWRFKTSDQAAVRQGDWKYLRIGGEEYVFNVTADPRERARLQDKYPEKLAELRSLFGDWNNGMLAYPEESFSESARRTYTDRY